MKFEKAPDGSWIRRSERQAGIRDRCIPEQRKRPRSERWRMVGPSSQPSFTELPHTELPSQAPHVLDHAPWMDVSAQISSLGTHIEELTLIFECIEERMDQQQATFEHLQQSIDHIESRQASQHEEMMAYLALCFLSTPSALRLARVPSRFLFMLPKGRNI
ncbi:hypothetical protein CK203_113623 [Vitis vinifera]|uniref:Uncharacterized protein n=1 Tax=Vitis vinifera TaxID=29760 RepID=A0A438FED9_VITVI|nr:hypothetical protein CK203_113623 [Vitis vinifera]